MATATIVDAHNRIEVSTAKSTDASLAPQKNEMTTWSQPPLFETDASCAQHPE
jgi:hypothetical protein